MVRFLFKAGGNPAKVFEFAEHAFDDMTLLVLALVTASLHLSICLGRYHRRNVTLLKPVEQCIGVIPLVSQQRARAANVHHEGNRLGDVRCLTFRQHEPHGQAQCICQRVNLATKTATRATQRLSSFVARGRARSACARTTVLSMQTFSKSALADTWAIILSQTPNRHQTSKALENATPMSESVP